ncbi:PASTA domain-containing protein [Ktedonosporobacter rubrisoli]|uniref:PASTA domain-containing protein n=1 Tax=Ktedonosporobacter rubrisoli TaxID=2509675 RepID=A0A4P6JW55_KTERU|nr:PASTA domain-containing protein [Ktedonosporobacter rubrisoli]QBD79918.1 PASTA domain-containing protein [Ktedonosporobacter rubrisoli]
MGRAGVVGEQRDSRFASVITILILLATLLLLGFSVYLAAELNFINIPGISGGQPTATTPQTLQVPQLVGKSLKDAQDIAGKNGFTLRISNGMTSGTVTKQDPAAGAAVPANSTISIDLAEATPTVTVPNDLVGKSLGEAEKILSQTQYANCVSLQVVGVNANLRVLPEQIVKDVQPKAGTSLKCDPNQPLVLLVDNSVPTQTVPTPTPSPTPSPTPTDEPSPTPTRHPKPTRTPKPDPTVTVSPGDGSAVSTTPGTQVTSGTGGNNGNNTNR